MVLRHSQRVSSTCDGTTASDRASIGARELQGASGTSGIAEAEEMARFGDRKMGFHDFVQEDAGMSHRLVEERMTRR